MTAPIAGASRAAAVTSLTRAGEQRKLATAARAGEKVSAKARKPRQKGADTAVRTTTAEVDADPAANTERRKRAYAADEPEREAMTAKDAALREFDGHVVIEMWRPNTDAWALMHGHCEATLTRSPRRSSTARRPRACAKNGSPVHDREKSGPRGLLLVHVHPRAVSGACPEALRKQAGAAARLEE